MNREKQLLSIFGAVLAATVLPAASFAASAGYWYSSSGEIWRNSYGECWRSSAWTKDNALPECEGGEVAKPAPPPQPRAAEPPPAPAVLDSDGDGVVDSRDACPDTPLGVRVDARGCELQERIELKGVTFATGSAQLNPSSAQTLDEAAETLSRYPELKVEVQGHTDSTGNREFNVDLSQRRAESVRTYLVNKGISAARLTARGYGPDRPIMSNATADGRARNRRVELEIRE